MAVPFRRKSSTRIKKGRSTKSWSLQKKFSNQPLVQCNNCQQKKILHHSCLSCSNYRGKKIISKISHSISEIQKEKK